MHLLRSFSKCLHMCKTLRACEYVGVGKENGRRDGREDWAWGKTKGRTQLGEGRAADERKEGR